MEEILIRKTSTTSCKIVWYKYTQSFCYVKQRWLTAAPRQAFDKACRMTRSNRAAKNSVYSDRQKILDRNRGDLMLHQTGCLCISLRACMRVSWVEWLTSFDSDRILGMTKNAYQKQMSISTKVWPFETMSFYLTEEKKAWNKYSFFGFSHLESRSTNLHIHMMETCIWRNASLVMTGFSFDPQEPLVIS